MEIESHEFWTTFAQTAATLAGFTLAGFSITAASADRVESDEICRRYGLREKSAFASWAFVFLVLMLFCLPLFLSLESLLLADSSPKPFMNYRGIATLGLVTISSIAVAFVLFEVIYIQRLIRFNIAEKDFNLTRGATKPNQPRWTRLMSRLGLSRLGLRPRVLGIGIVFLVPLATQLWCAFYITKPFWGSGLPSSTILVCVLSLVLGLAGIFVHYHVFRPEQLLFSSADPAELDLWRLKIRLEDTVWQIESMQAILVPVVKEPENRIVDYVAREDRCDREIVLRRFRDLEGRLEGFYYDPRTKETRRRQEALEYHRSTIEFCTSQPYLRYGSIRGLFKELEMFDLGLRDLSESLVRRREQYISLFRFLESQPPRPKSIQ